MYIKDDGASEVAKKASLNTDHWEKRCSHHQPFLFVSDASCMPFLLPHLSCLCVSSMLEKKMEAFQGYLDQHRHQIRLIIYIVLAAGKVLS